MVIMVGELATGFTNVPNELHRAGYCGFARSLFNAIGCRRRVSDQSRSGRQGCSLAVGLGVISCRPCNLIAAQKLLTAKSREGIPHSLRRYKLSFSICVMIVIKLVVLCSEKYGPVNITGSRSMVS